jgi:O-antigen ligase
MQFFLLCLLWIFFSFKPEWTIPGLKFIAPGQTFIQLFLLMAWVFYPDKKLRNPITKYFFLFVLLMAVSLFLARNTGVGRDIVRGMALLYITYLSTITFADTQKRVLTIINIYILGNLWIAVLGILGQGLAQGISIFDDQNDLALQMNVVLPIVIFLAMKERHLLKKLFYLTSGLIFLAVNIIGFSRGGFVGLVAVLVFVLLKLPIRRLKAILMILIIVGGTICFAPESYWKEMETLKEGTKEATADTRLFYWKVAIREFVDHPIIGVGPGNFGVWLSDYTREDDRLSDGSRITGGTKGWGRVCHSLYFTVLAELGVIGVILYSLMVYWVFKEIRLGLARMNRIKVTEHTKHGEGEENQPFDERYEKLRSLGLGIMGGLVGFLVSGAFLSVLFYPQFWLLCSLSTAMGNLTKNLVDEKTGRS